MASNEADRRTENRRRRSRRELLRVGMLGATGLGLPGLLRARAHEASVGRSAKDTSVVWLWLQGGASHIETFDPKSDAPADFRSMVGAIPTSLPGVEFGALFPRLAQSAQRMAVVRSFHHTNGDHVSASHYVMTANDIPGGSARQTNPSLGSITAKARGVSNPVSGVPTFVRLSRTISFDFDQPVWLGAANGPFDADGPTRKDLDLAVDPKRLTRRRGLRERFDGLRRDIDQTGAMAGMDSFEQQAVELILGRSKEALDINREHPRLRERYGPGLGEQLLAARRLCEAGCGFVTLNYAYAPKPSNTPFAWDMHLGPSQPNAPPMVDQLNAIFPMMDHAIAAFLEDVATRGLSEKILLVVTGDFGRTPKINEYGGRDHWPGLSTLALAGGGLRMGQVVGRSSAKAEFPTSSPVAPKDLMATILHVLGIAPDLQFSDYAGRPQYLLPSGAEPIAELI